MHIWLAAAPGLLMAFLAKEQSVHRWTFGDLFPSEGCSGCLPAYAKLPELARARSYVPPTFHVTYWGNLGWHDSYSLDLPTQLQRRFPAADVSPGLHTLALIAGRRRWSGQSVCRLHIQPVGKWLLSFSGPPSISAERAQPFRRRPSIMLPSSPFSAHQPRGKSHP